MLRCGHFGILNQFSWYVHIAPSVGQDLLDPLRIFFLLNSKESFLLIFTNNLEKMTKIEQKMPYCTVMFTFKLTNNNNGNIVDGKSDS